MVSKSLIVGGVDEATCRPPRKAVQTGKPAVPGEAANLPGKRAELIERVRAQIKAGTYETPQKLRIAIEKLLEDL